MLKLINFIYNIFLKYYFEYIIIAFTFISVQNSQSVLQIGGEFGNVWNNNGGIPNPNFENSGYAYKLQPEKISDVMKSEKYIISDQN